MKPDLTPDVASFNIGLTPLAQILPAGIISIATRDVPTASCCNISRRW